MSHIIMHDTDTLDHDDTDERKNPRLGFIILVVSALVTLTGYYHLFSAIF